MIAKDSFKQELTDLIYSYSKHIKKYISGNKTDYIFCPAEDEENGISDKNYPNRTRLCYALFYETYEAENKEDIVRELFIEEVSARENDSFQGIGINLEILTSLLLSYNRETDKPLFERAKNANFDCSCGYEPRILTPQPLSEFSLDDCIYLLCDLGEEEMMFRFADEFKSNISDLTDLKIFGSIAQYYTHRLCDREFAAKEIYSAFKKSPEEFKGKGFSAVTDYIKILIEKGEANEALVVFNENENIISEFERSYYELGARIIACGAENPKIIWEKILPFLSEAMKNRMAAYIYREDFLAAAELAGDTRFLKKLQKYFDNYFKNR